jgi:flavodoxin I
MEVKRMNHVLYYSMTGNTKKLAEAIARELGVGAKSIKTVTAVPQDGVLFIGSGCYGGKPGDDLAKFIEANDFSGRQVAVFVTSGGGTGNEVKVMAEALKGKGASVRGSYYCAGKAWLFFSRGHPDAKDLEGAREFAREMVKNG